MVALINLVVVLLAMKPGKTKGKVIELAPYAKNKWGWMKILFYVCCSRGKGWPLASTLSVFQFEAFPHNAPMDSKGKAPALTYRVVNMVGRSRKRRSLTVEPSYTRRFPKEARTEVAGEEKLAPGAGGATSPLGPVDFEISDMDLAVKSPLKIVSSVGFLTSFTMQGR